MQFLANAINNSVYILRNGSPFGKGRVLVAYWKLKFMHAYFFKLLHMRPTRTRVLGHLVHFHHLPIFIELFEEIFIKGEYTTPSNREWKTILDCGANIGIASLYFYMRYPHAHITSFEPGTQNFKALSQNVPSDRTTKVNKALAKKAETRSFYYDINQVNAGMSSFMKERHKKGSAVETVNCSPLSPYITGEIDFLKLDVEGAEQEILEELALSGKLGMVREMVIEYHHHVLPEDTFSKFLLILETNGFGYQIKVARSGTTAPPVLQDILLYAYRKDTLTR